MLNASKTWTQAQTQRHNVHAKKAKTKQKEIKQNEVQGTPFHRHNDKMTNSTNTNNATHEHAGR